MSDTFEPDPWRVMCNALIVAVDEMIKVAPEVIKDKVKEARDELDKFLDDNNIEHIEAAHRVVQEIQQTNKEIFGE